MYRRVVRSMFVALAVVFALSSLAVADMGKVTAVDDKGMATVMVGEQEVQVKCKGAKVGAAVVVTTKDGKTSCKMAKTAKKQ